MTFEQEPPVVVYRSRDAKVVRDRALVLNAMGISSQVRGQAGEHFLLVPHEQAQAATDELASYSSENVDWPPRYETPPLRSNGRIAAAIYALILLAFYPLGQRGAFGVNIWDPGKMYVGKLFDGDWWRVFTPLTLHADVSHLGGNLLFGIAFGILCSQLMGSGLAWLCIVLSGALGNLMSSSMRAADHQAIGASTAVFAAIGILSSFEWMRRHSLHHPPMRRLAPLAGGVILLGYLGTGGERTDVMAHLGGFVAGLVVGALVSNLGLPERVQAKQQLLCGLTAVALLALAWWAALSFAS